VIKNVLKKKGNYQGSQHCRRRCVPGKFLFIKYKEQGAQIFKKSRSQVSDSQNPQTLTRHRTKFSRHGDLAPGICAPLVESTFICRCVL